MAQIEIACKEAVFHFNKKHLEDPSIPMWVIKAKGKSYYVDHVTCEVPWSTKETPDNAHTKGSIKLKRCLITIDDDNCATITEASEDEERCSTKEKIRIITDRGKDLIEFLENYEHGDIKTAGGGCGTLWFVTELYSEVDLMMLMLAVSDVRVLMPNEDYYRMYDTCEGNHMYDDEDDWDDEDLYED